MWTLLRAIVIVTSILAALFVFGVIAEFVG